MHHGIKSVGLDGIEYRSDLEKMFVNKFLYQKYEYEYEKPYPTTTKHTCDFYFPLFNLWLEVVPYSDKLFEVELVEVIPEKIYLNVPYENRMTVKTNEAHWDAAKKSWYIMSHLLPKYRASDRLKCYLPEFPKITVDKKLTDEYHNFLEYYKNIDMKKSIIESRKELFCTVTESDLEYDTLLHLLQAKGLDGWRFIRAIENAAIPKNINKTEFNNVLTEAITEVIRFLTNPGTTKSALSEEQKKEISRVIIHVANTHRAIRTKKPKQPKKKKGQNG